MFGAFKLVKDYFGIYDGKMTNLKGLRLDNVTPSLGHSQVNIGDLQRSMKNQGVTIMHHIDMSYFEEI